MDELKTLLKDYPEQEVNAYLLYVQGLSNDPKTMWARDISAKKYAHWFKQVKDEGLVLDGKHITVQKLGLSYDYQAMKNKMLLVYPETKLECEIVYKGDLFTYKREGEKVLYTYEANNPFDQSEENIIGAFCVIRNSRGEFLERLGIKEIEKRRKVAKTDYIWRSWFHEMVKKTIIRKAVSVHFEDIFGGIIEEENNHSDLELPIDASLEWKQEIEAIDSLEALQAYHKANTGKGAAFDKLISLRFAELTK